MTQKDIRVEVRVRNNLVLRMMEKRGITTVVELHRQMKMSSQQALGRIINMKEPARNKDGGWVKTALALADFFQCMPEDLFSEPQQWSRVEKARLHAELAYTEIQELTRRGPPPTLEASIQAQELKNGIVSALSNLPARQERILRMRFGFGCEEMTLDEVGKKLGVTGSRVRELENKALRKLKHPALSRALKTLGAKDPEILDALE